MNKENIIQEQKTTDLIETQEKSLNELKTDLARWSRKLEESQVKLIQLIRHEEICQKKEKLLKTQTQKLNESINAENRKLDDTRRQVEAKIEDTVNTINTELDKNSHALGIKENEEEERKRKQKTNDIRRKKYMEMRSELEAMFLYKEYQESVLSELQKVLNIVNMKY